MVIAEAGPIGLCCCRTARVAATFVTMLATHASCFGRSSAALHRACSAPLVLVAYLVGHWWHHEGCAGERYWSWVCGSILLLRGGNQARFKHPERLETRGRYRQWSERQAALRGTAEDDEVGLGFGLVSASSCVIAIATMCLGLAPSR